MCSILLLSSILLTLMRGANSKESPLSLNEPDSNDSNQFMWMELNEAKDIDYRECQEEDGEITYKCPSKSQNERLTCIKRSQFCDQRPDCPDGSDEDRTKCMFMELTEHQAKQFRRNMHRLFIEAHEEKQLAQQRNRDPIPISELAKKILLK